MIQSPFEHGSTSRWTLAPVSVAGGVRTLKVFGNWLAAQGLGGSQGLRDLRRPPQPHNGQIGSKCDSSDGAVGWLQIAVV
jgi:hypothetical protein